MLDRLEPFVAAERGYTELRLHRNLSRRLVMRRGSLIENTFRVFRRAYPDIDLTLEEANTAPLITRLHEGTLDAAFLRPGAVGPGELQVRRLSEEPMVVALPKRHHAAAFEQIDLALLKDDPFLLFPREIAPTLYDTVVDACRKAGFEPILGQIAPHMASIVNLVAAELGVSIVPASLTQVRVTGIAYRQIAGKPPTTQLALAHRRGETSPVVRNFIARAVS
jgi:DNA-binding transcriptional LysR family regulator